MTEVCLLGEAGRPLEESLLSYEAARSALSPYDRTHPFANSLAIETVSLGAAVSLLNDLQWYLVRTTRLVLVREPSITEAEYLSRSLAEAIRREAIEPAESDRYLAVYGLVDDRPVDPMYVTRRDGAIPTYDLRDVEATVVVRVTEEEFRDG